MAKTNKTVLLPLYSNNAPTLEYRQMTRMEYWRQKTNNKIELNVASHEEDDISVGTLLREHPRQGPLNWQESLFPVVKKSDYDALKNKLAQYESGDLPTWKSEHDILKEVCDSLDKSNQELQKDLEIVRDSHRRQYQ